MTTDRHIWEYRWAHDLLWLMVGGGVLYGLYQARPVTVPVLVGFGLAYVVNPLVVLAQRRCRLPRWATALALLGTGGLVVVALGLYVVPRIALQLSVLIENLPRYIEQAGQSLGIDWGWLTQRAKEAVASATHPDAADTSGAQWAAGVDFKSLAEWVSQMVGTGIGWVGTAVGSVLYLGFAVVVSGLCFFYFSWHFDHMVAWAGGLVPRSQQALVTRLAGQMDQSIAAFVRGRVIQSLVMAGMLSVGWGVAGVPYWLLLGLAGGIANLVPYVPAVAWLTAVGLAWVDAISSGGVGLLSVFVWPSVVYFIAQGIDGWVVEPTVQGQATNLDPLSVMLSVMIGGSLAGLLGMMLAIPIAACIKILAQAWLVPKWRAAANSGAGASPPCRD